MTKTNFTSGSDGEVAAAGVFAENLDDGQPALTAIPDLTGVDLGIGVTDEDVTYIGSKTVLKAEIKKETTISLTRKKTDNVWDVVYNGPTATNEGWSGTAAETGGYGSRWGVIEGSADNWYVMNGSAEPKTVTPFGSNAPSALGSNCILVESVISSIIPNPEVIPTPTVRTSPTEKDVNVVLCP